MRKKPDPVHLDGFDLDALDFTIDLGPLDFEVPDLKVDVDSLDALLNFGLDLNGIGAGIEGGVLRTPIKTRHGVLAGGPQQCGAKTRKGTPCQCKRLPGKRRCALHGGLSTGPNTLEGRERIAEAQRRRWAKWRTKKDVPSRDR